MPPMPKWGLSPNRRRLLDAARGLLLDSHQNGSGRVADSSKSIPIDQRRQRKRILRCFPLRGEQFPERALVTPDDFHSKLLQQITNAQKRVYLASLYIGPAANPVVSPKEAQLLNALQSTRATDVKILLDHNRALRPVPICTSGEKKEQASTVTSAGACYRALQLNLVPAKDNALKEHQSTNLPSRGIFLLSVLPLWLQRLLPNPYNEVAGVFHLKCYIVDDDLILTGANLSEEYFSDRTDRYLWITNANSTISADLEQTDGGTDIASMPSLSSLQQKAGEAAEIEEDATVTTNDYRTSLIECYAEMVLALCRHAELYTENDPGASSAQTAEPRGTRTTVADLLDSLVEILTVNVEDAAADNDDGIVVESASVPIPRDVVAYAVPTLQVPPNFWQGLVSPIPEDTDVIANLLKTMVQQTALGDTHDTCAELRLTSAYLNLTNEMMDSMLGFDKIHLLTAGSMSHGFKVNPAKVGNKGKAWIPAVFDTLGRMGLVELYKRQQAQQRCNDCRTVDLWYYQRKDWTFHAKGMWLSTRPSSPLTQPNTRAGGSEIALGNESTLCVVTHGSGNYGFRSAVCDLESNLVLVLPDLPTPSTVTSDSAAVVPRQLQLDWNNMVEHTVAAQSEAPQPISTSMSFFLPFIRRFF